MEGLRECPFCGGEAEIAALEVERGWWAAEAYCTGYRDYECSVRMVCGGKTKRKAIEAVTEAWNRRNEE